jgi:hypothetical protein
MRGRYRSLVASTGEVIENPAARMRLRFLRTGADTNGELLEMEATSEPGSVEPLEHFHPRQDERFEIVSGAMRARIGGEEQPASRSRPPARVPRRVPPHEPAATGAGDREPAVGGARAAARAAALSAAV